MPAYTSSEAPEQKPGRLPRCTREYLEGGAPEGERNARLFDAACQFRDAGRCLDEAEADLLDRALADGLDESEARHTIRSAYAREARPPAAPSGNGASRSSSANGGAPSRRGSHPRSQAIELAPLPLPEPLGQGFTHLLDACFLDDEFVAIAPAGETEDGDVAPRSGVTLTAAEWKARVVAKGGIDRCFSTRLGLFIRINPLCQHGSRDEDVTAFRHVLVEFDRDGNGQPIAKEAQHAAVTASSLPVSALIDSGNKSLHAWVRVDARDPAEYRKRVAAVWECFEATGLPLDRQNRNPARLSRCPDGWRTVDGEVRQQRLLATKFGAQDWAAWAASHATDGLPQIVSGDEFMAVAKPEPPQLIQGVLHQGSKMILGGASKSRKSWSLIDLMLAVSTGGSWWGFPTRQGRVLYINFELPDFAFQHRLGLIAAAKGVTDYSQCDLWNLRGHATDLSDLIPKILARIKDRGYALIVLDPIYKGLGNRDENKAGDIASLCNEIEKLAVRSAAAVVFGAHYSKGNQAGKEAIDRIGGSGVFARDPDVILTMTPHEERDAYVVDLTLRALPPVEPFVVRWEGVCFQKDEAADPSLVRKPGKAAKDATPKATYHPRGSVAAKYGPLFESMPAKVHHKDSASSEVIQHIIQVLTAAGESCDETRAASIFDMLRHYRYGVIRFVGGAWVGRQTAPASQEGGQP